MISFSEHAVKKLFQAYALTYAIENEFEEKSTLFLWDQVDLYEWEELKAQLCTQMAKQRELIFSSTIYGFFPMSAKDLSIYGFDSADEFMKILEQCPDLISSCSHEMMRLLEDLEREQGDRGIIPDKYFLSREQVKLWREKVDFYGKKQGI